jgi:hypothetical protein
MTISSNSNSDITFCGLFERYNRVEIPILQRDYAQGRAGEREVREEFLEALHAALSKSPDDPSLPLNLDFVYGNVDDGNSSTFLPLDGQQRLTTLFLLHWYVAWQDGANENFSATMSASGRSRFTYAVRISSREFFDALVCWAPDATPATMEKVSLYLVDQPWFFRSWQRDPTIQSVLVMLDAIHRHFGHTHIGYQRLIDTARPSITMQLLDLERYGLSDDLYIKMNARGKPLTVFETFKARLEAHIADLLPELSFKQSGRHLTVKEYFSHQVDTTWADLFWHYSKNEPQLFDSQFMQLVRTIVLVTRNAKLASAEPLLHKLRTGLYSFSFLDYQENGCLDASMVSTLIALLDAWAGHSGGIRPLVGDNAYFDETVMFRRIVQESTQLTYAEQVQFQAYACYVERYKCSLSSAPFAAWMRIVVNLTLNTPYDNIGDLRRSMEGIHALIEHAPAIIEYMANVGEVNGFASQQVREEKLKAQLMLRSSAWEARILSAERHAYFEGQIEFMFKFSGVLDAWLLGRTASWPDSSNEQFLSNFDYYFDKVTHVFTGAGLCAVGNRRWERALLSIGDYLLPTSRNLHFLQNLGRDISWKRLLRGGGDTEAKRDYVKVLLDRIDFSRPLADALDDVIASAPVTGDWRDPLIRCVELMDYCGASMIRRQTPDQIYLLRKQRRSGEHVELYTYHLYCTKLKQLVGQAALDPFTRCEYHYVNTDSEEPYVQIQAKSSAEELTLAISYSQGVFSLRLAPMAGRPHGKLRSIGFEQQSDGSFVRELTREHIMAVITDLAEIVRLERLLGARSTGTESPPVS